jgi:flavin-dependent dehydrogenase
VIVVAGGGPAGSTCATRLAQLGHRVLVLEKERFPRFHLGESLLPCSVEVFGALGVLDKIDARYLRKYGARFHEDASGKVIRFTFSNALRPKHAFAYQVPRDDFDALLLDHAREAGAEVREGWSVTRLHFDRGRAAGVVARAPDGSMREIAADFVVDATGRDALQAHATRSREKIAQLDRSAFYSHYRGVPRAGGEEEGDIDIVVFRSGWFWVIPFRDGRTSVGAVVPSAWVKARRDLDADAMLEAAILESPTLQRMLASAEKLWPGRATGDYSYRVRELAGEGWLAVGDAGGFIDPLFSTGAHLAFVGAKLGAESIHEALRAGDPSPARFEAWRATIARGLELFVSAVQAFYAGDLVRYIFAADSRDYLRRAITSMLTGDVFEETRWTNDLRVRLPKLAQS